MLDADGERGGTVAAADAEFLVVAHGVFFGAYVGPLGVVGADDGEALRLAVTREAVRRGAWEANPRGRP